MAHIILIAFIVIPLAEIYILIKLGGMIGTLPTIALVIVTAVIGTTILRRQGLKVLANAQRSVGEGRVPVDSVVDGFCLAISGAFLLTPGLITDSVGFLLLIPPLRRWLARWVFHQAALRGLVDFRVFTGKTKSNRNPGSSGKRPGEQPSGRSQQQGQTSAGPVIEGEFERIDEPDPPSENKQNAPRKDSPWSKRR